MDSQVLCGNLSSFSTCRGSWRPDFLVEDGHVENGVVTEKFRITEINARFSFNGFMHEVHGQDALEDLDLASSGLAGATNPKEVILETVAIPFSVLTRRPL